MTNTRRVLRPLVLALGLAMAAPMISQANTGPDAQGPRHEQGFHDKQGFGGHRGGGDFTRRLNLTEAQKDKIFELRYAAEPAFRAKGKEVRAARSELRTVGMTDKFDENRAVALSNQAARAEAEFTVMRLRLTNQIYNVLTPEQRKQAAQVHKPGFERTKAPAPAARPAPQVQ